VICNEIIAESYMDLIKSLGIEYSVAKTHRSTHFYEFAKRIFYKNKEVSPFPFSAIKEVSKSYEL
jgi:protoporphyrinogen oxidase